MSNLLRDRPLWLVLVLSATVLLPRSWMITRAQSERFDDEYHIRRGALFLSHALGPNPRLNDPPLGEAIGVLPLWLANCWPTGGPKPGSAIWGQRYSADTILNVIGLWKSLLFLPMIAVVFVWLRQLYGNASAWIAVAILLVEPTIAAHTPLPTIDVIGMEGIVIACFLIWRYFQSPSWARLAAASISIGVAMLLKHTAVILPATGLLFAFMWWFVRPWWEGRLQESWRGQVQHRIIATISGAFIVGFTIWALMMFDVRKPAIPANHPALAMLLGHRIPAGMYVTSVFQAAQHADRGHPGYLWGEVVIRGRWYYFPVVGTYKVPLGIGVLLMVGLVSLLWRKLKWDEWALFIPLLMWTALMLTSHINIGWRHFLPAYAFMLLGATRILCGPTRWCMIAAWTGVVLAFGDTVRWHPDYISYITWPRKEGWRNVSDSNVDWGQGLKYVRRWIVKNRDREIYVHSYAWRPQSEYVRRRLGPGVTLIDRTRPQLPTSGVLIISPVPLVGDYVTNDPWRALRKYKPNAVLGHSMFVYDLDQMGGGKPFNWGYRVRPPLPTSAPATEPTTTDEDEEIPE